MKVSIITVCFNAKEAIDHCIDSVLSQDFEEIEYIIIDGLSTDGTIDIILEYGERISKFISESDNGIFDAMNKGLALAQGDWILFLNSDDVLYKTTTISDAAQFLIDKEKNYYGIAEITHNGATLYNKPNQQIPIDFEHDMPIHQAVFISKLYNDRRFDTRYTISADSVYLYKLSKESQFELIPVCIASFALGGASSWYQSFSKYRIHLREHTNFLRIKESSISIEIYTYLAFTSKYILSRLMSQFLYFRIVAYVAKLKTRF